MKIKSATVSNILSFPFIEDIDGSSETIVFDTKANILIGPNGSGKSNLLEILSKLMEAYFFTQFEIEDNAMALNQEQKPIRLNTNNNKLSSFNNLVKHRDFNEKESKLKLVLSFDMNDISNLKFIVENFDELSAINRDYTTQSSFFNKQWNFDDLKFDRQLDVCFFFTLSSRPGNQIAVQVEQQKLSHREVFIHDYLEYFNLIQRLIEVGITIKGKPWQELKTTFALIGSLRQFGGFVKQISIGVGSGNQLNAAAQNSFSNSTKNAMSADTVFQIAFMKVGQIIKLNREGRYTNEYLRILQTEEGSLIKRINDVLDEIGLKVSMHSYNLHSLSIQVSILNSKNEVVDFNELSTGQKSIFHLIFSVYGFDLKNGLLIIDEPELHLHTSMQKKYFQILKKIAEPFNLQVILATHSPVFIDENTIQNTFRFSKQENNSFITRPNRKIDQTQKDLLQFLTYTNSSRIFFSDIVILVEGSSDEYFFKYFYDNYYLVKRQTKLTIEFLNIGGKGNRKKWADFLNLFAISNAYIGDFDNIQNEGVAHSAGVDYEKLISDIKQGAIAAANQRISVSGTSSKDGVALLQSLENLIQKDFVITNNEKIELRNLWQYILERCGVSSGGLFAHLSRAENIGTFQKIRDEIVKKYSENIYILQRGDLETYLETSKDINKVIDFCAKDFQEWIKNEESKEGNDSKLIELMNIMDSIINKERGN